MSGIVIIGPLGAGVFGAGVLDVGLAAASPESEPQDAPPHSARAEMDQVMIEVAAEKRNLVMRG
jgi:hypothetical protein